MLDILYNSYNGVILNSHDRSNNEENNLKNMSRDFITTNPNSSTHLSFMPGSEAFPFVRPYQCSNCNKVDNDGCCKVITVESNYPVSNLMYNYRVDVEQSPNIIVKTHEPVIKFYNSDTNEEYVYDSNYKAYLLKGNTKAVVSFYKDGVFDNTFHDKIIRFDVTNAISVKTITSSNGIAEANIIFAGSASSGKITVYGEFIGNNINYCPTNILSVNYVFIKE